MSVYVDELRPVAGDSRWLLACHMMADTDEELERMARRIGMHPDWRDGDHYDLVARKRYRAKDSGAIEVTQRDLVKLRQKKRDGRSDNQ